MVGRLHVGIESCNCAAGERVLPELDVQQSTRVARAVGWPRTWAARAHEPSRSGPGRGGLPIKHARCRMARRSTFAEI